MQDEEDCLPDWSQFAQFAQSVQSRTTSTTTHDPLDHSPNHYPRPQSSQPGERRTFNPSLIPQQTHRRSKTTSNPDSQTHDKHSFKLSTHHSSPTRHVNQTHSRGILVPRERLMTMTLILLGEYISLRWESITPSLGNSNSDPRKHSSYSRGGSLNYGKRQNRGTRSL